MRRVVDDGVDEDDLGPAVLDVLERARRGRHVVRRDEQRVRLGRGDGVKHRVLEGGVELVRALDVERGAGGRGGLLGPALHGDVEGVALDADHEGDVLARRRAAAGAAAALAAARGRGGRAAADTPPGSTPQGRRPQPTSAVSSSTSLLVSVTLRRHPQSPTALSDSAVGQPSACRDPRSRPFRNPPGNPSALGSPRGARHAPPDHAPACWRPRPERPQMGYAGQRAAAGCRAGRRPSARSPSRSTAAKSEVSTDRTSPSAIGCTTRASCGELGGVALPAGGPGGGSGRRTERRGRRATRGTRPRPTARSRPAPDPGGRRRVAAIRNQASTTTAASGGNSRDDRPDRQHAGPPERTAVLAIAVLGPELLEQGFLDAVQRQHRQVQARADGARDRGLARRGHAVDQDGPPHAENARSPAPMTPRRRRGVAATTGHSNHGTSGAMPSSAAAAATPRPPPRTTRSGSSAATTVSIAWRHGRRPSVPGRRRPLGSWPLVDEEPLDGRPRRQPRVRDVPVQRRAGQRTPRSSLAARTCTPARPGRRSDGRAGRRCLDRAAPCGRRRRRPRCPCRR